ncbi:putative acyl-CoA thioesterase [Trypanosoma theileri]|uniref:Putative acyl-CoA thioesterase n=1 Tax=Trypanosoma theileri TaxID=67003 RepID=A0A1X0NVA5_9TRYP|nr:putative acyl-CoA thioesterase [Trypanosoma theileri]ORC88478.1 putative acyl-CoA thioesterase [Trypanosoma theileri]
MELHDFLKDFKVLFARALKLENVGDNSFRSIYLWTPFLSKATYGGQLVAHCTEAAYRTVDASKMNINSLQVKFVSAGKSECGEQILYTVKSLHNGRSFCTRLVTATQQERIILVAFVGFSKRERGGIEHQMCSPFCMTGASSATGRRNCSISKYIEHLETSCKQQEVESEEKDIAQVKYLNFMDLCNIQSINPWDVWLRLNVEGWNLLKSRSGIPEDRLHIIVACWLSDFILAFASLFPHGFPNSSLRFITSLDHTIHFHHPENIRVDDWFLYEVYSPWAAHSRGLNEGRMYGRDGLLWMSTSQQTVLRLSKDYYSKL